MAISKSAPQIVMQVDDESPFLREVALWAVRNLCEGNLSIQRQIEQLQVVDVVETPEMQAAGVSLEHNPQTGRVSLSQSAANRLQADEGEQHEDRHQGSES